MIRERTGEIRGKAADVADQTRQRAEKVIASARGRAEDIAQTTKEKTAQVMRKESDMLDDASRRMQS
jgi:F0F1-type ATP synthase membrane subunit b/b'